MITLLKCLCLENEPHGHRLTAKVYQKVHIDFSLLYRIVIYFNPSLSDNNGKQSFKLSKKLLILTIKIMMTYNWVLSL